MKTRLFRQLRILVPLTLGACSSLVFAVSEKCNRYPFGSEFYDTCALYDDSKIDVRTSIDGDLDAHIAKTPAGTLTIIPSGVYPTDEPVKLTDRKGLMPAENNGFIQLKAVSGFSIKTDPVFCMLFMGERAAMTGLKIDGGHLSSIPEYANSTSKLRTLVYSHNSHGLKLSWFDLSGTQGMDGVVRAENSESQTITEGSEYNVRKGWVEPQGADEAIHLHTALPSAGASEYVNVKHLAVILDEDVPSNTTQLGLHIRNSGEHGEIEHNYIVYRNSNIPMDRTRIGMRLHNVKQTVVTENSFISEQSNRRSPDVQFDLLDMIQDELSSDIFANTLDTKTTAWTGNVDGSSIPWRENYGSDKLGFFLTKDVFFGRGANGGPCFIDRYLLEDFDETMDTYEERTGLPGNSTELASYLCGSSVKSGFNKTYDFGRQNCNCPTVSQTSCKAAEAGLGVWGAVSTVFNVVQTVALFGTCVWASSRSKGKEERLITQDL